MPPIPGTPLHRLLPDPKDTGAAPAAALAALHDADVILGRDAASGDEFVVFGRDVLRQVSEGKDEAFGYNVLCVEIDRAPGAPDLELLLKLVESVKGSQEFIDYGTES